MMDVFKRQLIVWLCTFLSIVCVLAVGAALTQWFSIVAESQTIDPWSLELITFRLFSYGLLITTSPTLINLSIRCKQVLNTRQETKENRFSSPLIPVRNMVRRRLTLLILFYEVVIIANPLGIVLEVLYGR